MKETATNTIGVAMVRQSLEGALSAGHDIRELMNKSGISYTLLEQSNARIPVDQFVRLYRYTCGAMKDESAGLLSKPTPLGFFRAMALSAVHAGTLSRALRRSIEFNNLFEGRLYQEMRVKDKHVEFILTENKEQSILNHFAVEFILTMHHRFIGWLANTRIILEQVKLNYPAPEHSGEYQHMFYGAPVLFDQDCNSLQFDSAYLSRPIVQNEASVESFVRRAPLDLYLPLDAGGQITSEVRNKVNNILSVTDTAPELNRVAKEMQLYSYTLRRKLKKEGTNFHTITAQVRRDIAIHHLGAGELSIENIAYKAGYTEPSAFIRAFKAWTGFTPLNFRKGLEI